MDGSFGWLFGRIVESVTSQERRATQTDVLTNALNRSVLQTMMVFHSQQNTFCMLIEDMAVSKLVMRIRARY